MLRCFSHIGVARYHLPFATFACAIYNNIMKFLISFDPSQQNEPLNFFLFYFFSCFASGSIWFSLRFKRMWPLNPSSVADWALWDANWPCNNTSNCDIVPCKMGKTHCRLISVANSYSSDHNLYEAGHFFQSTYFNKKPVSILQPYLCWEILPSVFKTR